MLADFINHITNLNTTLAAVVLMLVAVGAYIMHIFLDSRYMTVLSVVVFTLGAFLTEYLAKVLNIHISSDPETDLLLLSTLGMSLSLVVIIAISRLYGAAINNSKVKVRG